MNKLDSLPPVVKHPVAIRSPRAPAGRLIVVFPASAGNLPNSTRHIWEIAGLSSMNVLLLSLCSNDYDESQLRRQLIVMAAMISGGRVHTDIKIGHGKDWVAEVKSIYRPGDVIACYAGHQVGPKRRLLQDALQSELGAPVHLLPADAPVRDSRPSRLLEVTLWLGTLAIMAGFLWMEIKIIALPQDWVHTSFFYVCVLLEIGLIWLWNSHFPNNP